MRPALETVVDFTQHEKINPSYGPAPNLNAQKPERRVRNLELATCHYRQAANSEKSRGRAL